MSTTVKRLFWVYASGIVAAALTVGCGGGGGGSGGGASTGASQVSGSLNKASGMQIASRGRSGSLFERVSAWLGARSAMAEATTN